MRFFYSRIWVEIYDGKKFGGNAGGLGSLGGGALMGDVYMDDLDKLYKNTVSFEYNATPVYTNVNFFDSDSNLLGHFQAGAVSVCSGIGDGTGSWS